MTTTQATKEQSEAARAFWKGLRDLRSGLPSGQREALDSILANATKSAILAKAAVTASDRGASSEHTTEAVELARKLKKYRSTLAARERYAFDALMAAGATQGDFGGSGESVAYNLVIGLLVIGLAPPLIFAIAAGIESVVNEPEAEAPDLTGIPPSPEDL